ncbi:MAG: tRNA pseudouridine(55) synthase TruB [Deltaproteobacteria bacterium]
MSAPLDGVLIVDKPEGPTSSDIVLRLRRLCRGEKVGHTGTLDPLATGLVQFLALDDKVYRATARLGARTDTGDREGRVVEERPVPSLDLARVEVALKTLRGEQLQRPPMYSAVKVLGERLYEIARRGEEVERAPRPIRVDRFDLIALEPPLLTVEIACSKGTYVRTLVEELGERLSCGAHLTALRRLRSGRFEIEQAVELSAIERASPPERQALLRDRLITLEAAVAGLPVRRLDAREADGVRHGRAPAAAGATPGLCALLDPAGALVAMGEVEGERLRLACVLSSA